jgi:lipopolysaccharide export system permease protein
MNVLFITSNRLGDAVLSTGLLDHIICNNKNARISIACGPLPESLFSGVPGLSEIYVLKKQRYNKHWFDLWKKVNKTRWDLVVDLRNSIVSRVVHSHQRFVYGKHISKEQHKVEQNAEVMKLSHVPSPRLWFTDKQLKDAQELLGISETHHKILAIGATANWLGKTWPAENFCELLKRLTKKEGFFRDYKIAIFGAPGEETQALPVFHSLPQSKRVNMIAKTDPGTAAAALSLCSFFIGHDSGLMHCSAASGVPTLGLFGPSYPHLYKPWGEKANYVSTAKTFDELIDFPGYDPKTVGSLMTSLTLEDVEAAVYALIEDVKDV